MEALLDHLRRKIRQIETDRWGEKQAPVVRLDAAEDAAGRLSGALEIVLRKRDGAEFVFHRESLDGVATAEAADDRLAAALSLVLSRHPKWPHVAEGPP
jgi:hypothetical protein